MPQVGGNGEYYPNRHEKVHLCQDHEHSRLMGHKGGQLKAGTAALLVLRPAQTAYAR